MPKTTKIIRGYVVDITETKITLVEKYGNRRQYCIPITPQVGEDIQLWDLVVLRVTGFEEDVSHPTLRSTQKNLIDSTLWGMRVTTQWTNVTEVSLLVPPQRVPRLGGWFHCVNRKELEQLQKYFRGYEDAIGEDISVSNNTNNPEYINLVVSTRRDYVTPINTTGKTDYLGAAETAIRQFLQSHVIIHEPAEDLAQKFKKAAKAEAE
jgi:hypothetical protein